MMNCVKKKIFFVQILWILIVIWGLTSLTEFYKWVDILLKKACVRLPKENVFCANNASEIFNSSRHQKLLLVANQLQQSTFLFEINSENIGKSNLISQLKYHQFHSVHWGINLSPQKHHPHPYFLPSSLPP